MNEKIKELSVEAGITTNLDTDYFERDMNKWVDYYTEKFAELLIRECAEHCKGQILDKEVADTNELTYNDAVMDCSNGLLQHFGLYE